MSESVLGLFGASGFMPHGHCYLWTPWLLWQYLVSDLIIGLSYYSIPLALLVFIRRRPDIEFSWVFLLFAVFIFACGTTHLIAIWTIWNPDYWLDASMKSATALVSLTTAVALWPLLPKVLNLPSQGQLRGVIGQLEAEVRQRSATEAELATLNQNLERRVQERTAELREINLRLLKEIESHQLTESRLRKSEQRFREVVEAMPSALVVADEGGRIAIVNSSAERLFGFSRSELTGRQVEMLVPLGSRGRHPQLREGYLAARGMRTSLAERELLALRKDGTEVPVDIRLSLISTDEGAWILSALTDISERIAAEQVIRESSRRLEESQRVAGLAHWEHDLVSGSVFWAGQMFVILGIDPVSVEPRMETFMAAVVPADREAVAIAMDRAIHGQDRLDIEHRVARPDGAIRYVHLQASLVRNAHGQPLRLSGIVVDITDRKQMELKLARSELRYRVLIDVMPEGVLIEERSGISFANEAAVALLGSESYTELHGRGFDRFADAGSAHTVKTAVAEALSGQRPWQDYAPLMMQRKNGRAFEAEFALISIDLRGTRAVQIVFRDVSAANQSKRDLEAANLRLQFLSSRLIEVQETERRTIAHELHDEIGQALTAVKVHLDLFARGLERESDQTRIGKLVGVVQEALGQVRSLSLRLRPPHLDNLGLEAALRWMMERLFEGGSTRYLFDCEPLNPRPDPQVETAAFRIVQESLTNVVRHANASEVRVSVARAGDRLLLRVSDDGKGFAGGGDEALTDARQSLGLSGMQERATLLGGELRIRSQPGAGTDVQAELPYRLPRGA